MPLTTKQDISGSRFGRLVAIKFIPDDSKYAKFLFMCDCGKQLIVLSQSVRSGNTLSCGCLHNEIASKVNYKHGHSGKGRTKTYNSWASMMTRCEWGNHSSYKSYGAKGIRVCADWFRYENFLLDMGERPNGKSIDRIDGTKGYSKENCRWATREEQNRNTTRNIHIIIDGNKTTIPDVCDKYGISKLAMSSRARRRGNDYVAALESYGIKAELSTA